MSNHSHQTEAAATRATSPVVPTESEIAMPLHTHSSLFRLDSADEAWVNDLHLIASGLVRSPERLQRITDERSADRGDAWAVATMFDSEYVDQLAASACMALDRVYSEVTALTGVDMFALYWADLDLSMRFVRAACIEL